MNLEVSGTGFGAAVGLLAVGRGRLGVGVERVSGATDPAHAAGRNPGDQSEVGDIPETTAPAATVAHAPMRTGATHTARAPMLAPSPIVTPTACQSEADFSAPSGVTARG